MQIPYNTWTCEIGKERDVDVVDVVDCVWLQLTSYCLLLAVDRRCSSWSCNGSLGLCAGEPPKIAAAPKPRTIRYRYRVYLVLVSSRYYIHKQTPKPSTAEMIEKTHQRLFLSARGQASAKVNTDEHAAWCHSTRPTGHAVAFLSPRPVILALLISKLPLHA